MLVNALKGWFRILEPIIRPHFQVSLGVVYQWRQISKVIKFFQLHSSPVLG